MPEEMIRAYYVIFWVILRTIGYGKYQRNKDVMRFAKARASVSDFYNTLHNRIRVVTFEEFPKNEEKKTKYVFQIMRDSKNKWENILASEVGYIECKILSTQYLHIEGEKVKAFAQEESKEIQRKLERSVWLKEVKLNKKIKKIKKDD